MRNILIFHAGALGDFVLSWPLAVALGRMFPQSRIIYVTASQKGKLAQKALGVESADSEAGWQNLFGGQSLPDKCRAVLAGARLIVSFVADENDPWTAAVKESAPAAQIIHLTTRPPASWQRRAVDFLIDQLGGSPAIALGTRQILSGMDERGLGLWRGGGDVLIHPGSGGRHKCWPAEKFLDLIGGLKDAGFSSRVILGEVELERMEAGTIRRFESVATVKRPVDYVELLAELSVGRAYVGNDSGPTHLAGVIGTPIVAIFISSAATVWRPMGPRVAILGGDEREPTVDEALASVQSACRQS